MKHPPRLARVSATTGLILLSLPAFAQYNANDITPPSSNTGKLTAAANGKQVGGSGNGHAMMLNGNALNSVDLHPVGYVTSMATSTDDVQQCGYVYSYGHHSALWSGSAASFVDLAAGFNGTYCNGVHGGQQVGYGETFIYTVSIQHALMWTGSPAGYVDLHPIIVGYPYSKAMGVRSGQQIGFVSQIHYSINDTGPVQGSHAIVWNGTAASAVDLNPIGFDSSQGLATNGVQQGGWARVPLSSSQMHAMLWSGTADSAVDLHPAGFTDSRITAVTATMQVGDGWVGPGYQAGSIRHALVWSGTAASVVDLNQYLPVGYANAVATGIDANGNVVGYAYNTFNQGMDIPPDAIAMIFAPGQGAPAALSSLTLLPGNIAPGGVLQGTVSIPSPAPAAGVGVSFVSADQTLIPAPTAITIPAGQTSSTFSIATGGAALQVPSMTKLIATDGTTSRSAMVTLTPVVNLSSVTINPVEGGFSTTGTIALSIPAQAGGAIVTLTSGNPTLAAVPASVTLALGSTTASFTVSTTSVSATTTVPVTATFGGRTINSSVIVSAAPVVSVSAVTFSFPSIVGGQSITGTVSVNNFPRSPNGAVITLTSSDPNTLRVPASITIPYGAFSAGFTATTVAVTGTKGVSVKASYDASNITSSIQVVPIPTVTIIKADYYTDTNLLKVQATTTYANSVLTFGTDPNLPSLGSMSFELGQFNASIVLATAPAYATVWNSNGGQATMIVTQRTTPSGGGGGGVSTNPKLTVSKSSKGTITSNPAGIACGSSCIATYPNGTVVTLTATPVAGSFFGGWNGACVGTSPTCTLTMTADKAVSPVFR